MRWQRLVWLVVVMTLAAVGCTAGKSEEEIAASEAASETAAARRDVADLGILADQVAARDEGASEFLPAEDGTSLDVGDAIQTDTAGRAQLTYADGSLTRIDKDSTFEIVELALEPLKAQLKLDAGRVWNRVQDLTETQGSFEVETPVATAAVRGTAFTVECVRDDDACTFSVAEGLVEVTTITDIQVLLAAGESVTVLADGSIEGVVALEEDDWIADNLEADDDDGFAAVALPEEPDEGGALAAANISGTWNVTHTVTNVKPKIRGFGAGVKAERAWEIKQSCDAPCPATSPRVAQSHGGKMQKNSEPALQSAGGIYTYDSNYGLLCEDTETHEVLVDLSFEGPVKGEFWVAAATVDGDGELSATTLVGRRTGELKLTPKAKAHPTCSENPNSAVVEWKSIYKRTGD